MERRKDSPMADTSYKDLSLHNKIDILYSLCMSRLDAEDVSDFTKVGRLVFCLKSLFLDLGLYFRVIIHFCNCNMLFSYAAAYMLFFRG